MNRLNILYKCIKKGIKEGYAEYKAYGISRPIKVIVNENDTCDMII
jgi:hypothetical protein